MKRTQTLTQTLIGAFTALLWIFVGGYLIATGEGLGWQVGGGVAVALGLMRGIALLVSLRGPRP